MYIAVISDNIANRKHMERLLDRTSDAIMSQTGNLYIESFGNPETMWPVYKRYDLFVIDAVADSEFINSLIDRFVELNLVEQVTVCQQEQSDYSNRLKEMGFSILLHPLNVTTLSEHIVEAYGKGKQTTQEKHIVEFRSDNETHYIEAACILYAKEKKHVVTIYLADGTTIDLSGDLFSFKRAIEIYDEFVFFSNDIIINKNHIIKTQGRNITLANNHVIKLPLFKKSPF